MKLRAALPALALIALTACGGGNSPQEKQADALDNAAEQSDPAAAAVLENQADALREGNAGGAANAQDALQNAGNAQATTVSQPETPPPSMQAVPNRTGQQTPPPKERTTGQ